MGNSFPFFLFFMIKMKPIYIELIDEIDIERFNKVKNDLNLRHNTETIRYLMDINEIYSQHLPKELKILINNYQDAYKEAIRRKLK